jgi:hypothetical protein
VPALVSKSTFGDLAAELHRAVEWFERMGVDVRKSRLGRYVDHLGRLVKAHETQNFDEITDDDQSIKNALFEANEFITIFRRLSAAQYDDTVRERLVRIATGPEHYPDETPAAANSARNFAFELLVADRLVGGGLTLATGTGADTAVVVEGRTIAVECKRLMGDTAAEKRFKEAHKQLKRRYAAASRPGMRGLIALDITRAANPSFAVLRVDNSTSIRPAMLGMLEDFVKRHRRTWAYTNGSKTVALLLRLSLLAVLKEEKSLITYCHHWLLCPLAVVSDRDRTIMDAIGGAIGNANAGDHDLGSTISEGVGAS